MSQTLHSHPVSEFSQASKAEKPSILAIDTAFDICSVACLLPGFSDIRFSEQKRKHADDVLVMLQSMLAQHCLTLADFDAIAMTSGPGSFTGLRIGTAVVQGLAFGAVRPVICVSSLAAIAASTSAEFHAPYIVCCLHAREDEFYFAVYRCEVADQPEPVLADCISTPDLIRAHLSDLFQPGDKHSWVAVGDGWQHDVLLDIANTSGLRTVAAEYNALVLAAVARRDFIAGKAVPAALAAPVYLKEELEYRTV